MKRNILLGSIFALLLILLGCQASSVYNDEIEMGDLPGTVILGRPTDTTMTASITTAEECEVYLLYGETATPYSKQTEVMVSTQAKPAVFVMEELSANMEVTYTVCFKEQGKSEYRRTTDRHFSMPKTQGNSFSFVVQSDSHLVNKADLDLYAESMEKMAALNPDFLFDLGDTFLVDNGSPDVSGLMQEDVDRIYRQQLPYFSRVTKSAPLFLTIGNHESEYGVLLDGTGKNLAAKSTFARTTYYPNPIPNEFYSGNREEEALFGSPQNYYAFTWGDALFVSIDPYRYSENGASEELKGDGWGWSLGKSQYDWFRETLEESEAQYKFVLAHHAIGNIRGGAKVANLYEWGGYDQRGKYRFDEMRPGWGKPIQQIMEETGVTIFFQGHDHLFAREEVDGVMYQTLPKPAEKVADPQSNFKDYTGDILHNSGFLNIQVKEDCVQVDYNRNYLVASGEQTTGVVYSYQVDLEHRVTVLKTTEDVLEDYGKNEASLSGEGMSNREPGKKGREREEILPDFVGVGAVPAQTMTPVPLDGFSFAIEADPHFDENYDDAVLDQTARQLIDTEPDFLIDLGDTSMLEKLGKTPETAAVRKQLVESYFSKFGERPIHMVTGNHDVAVNNGSPNYYAHTGGDVQIITLDPYAYSKQSVGKGGGWATTLGKIQYDWLENTLATSQAEYKFVYIHNLTGGIGNYSRGGAEAAAFFEWGGNNENGVYEFDKMRPGWEMPIHDLLVKYGVDVVFHGHDHFYARQEKDGLVYLLVPQPGTPGNSVYDAREYSYESGTLLPSPGFVRVVGSEENVTVEYIHTDKDGFTIPDTFTIEHK